MEDTKDFYPIMKSWWKGHGFPVVALEFLPEKVFIYNNKTADTYCCTMYKTDSLLAWTAWPISNPKIKGDNDQLKEVFLAIEKYAKELGYMMLFTTSKHETVINKLLDMGFLGGDENVKHYLKII